MIVIMIATMIVIVILILVITKYYSVTNHMRLSITSL